MPRRQARVLTAVVVMVAVAASACGGGRDATSALADALRDLAGESFAYTLTLELDGDAVGQLFGPLAGAGGGWPSAPRPHSASCRR